MTLELSKNIRFSFLCLLLSYLCLVPSLSLVHPIKGSRRSSYDTTVQNQRRIHIQRENNYSPQPRTSPLTLLQASSSENGGSKSVKKAVTKKTTKSTKVTKPLVESSSSPPPVQTKPTLVQKRKSDLVSAVAAATGMKSSECETCINAFLKTIVEEVAAGSKVSLSGFGTFQPSERAARKGRNPKTGEDLYIAAKKAPTFRALTAFKDRVNEVADAS